jgi:uncharacterized protein YndB with AHSA1/START domain
MPTTSKSIASAYHEAWTEKRFASAIDLLAPTLHVEVPINDYPTKDSFADALQSFGRRVGSVTVLSEMAADDEAMILYDMDVEGLGTMRVVEHFTVANGKIVRLRQIHDTAALRNGARSEEPAYTDGVEIAATAARVFDALTTRDGISGWWTSFVTGSPIAGETIELAFAGIDERIVMRVGATEPFSSVVWSCIEHTGHPEWVGTTVVFEIEATNNGSTELRLHHIGLVPDLDCFEQCEAGWRHFLRSIKGYVERGEGMPFTP